MNVTTRVVFAPLGCYVCQRLIIAPADGVRVPIMRVPDGGKSQSKVIFAALHVRCAAACGLPSESCTPFENEIAEFSAPVLLMGTSFVAEAARMDGTPAPPFRAPD